MKAFAVRVFDAGVVSLMMLLVLSPPFGAANPKAGSSLLNVRVASVTVGWDAWTASEAMIFTDATVEVTALLSGPSVPSTLVVRQLGGTVGNISLLTEPFYTFEPLGNYRIRISIEGGSSYHVESGTDAFVPLTDGTAAVSAATTITGGNGYELIGARWGGYGTDYRIWENTNDITNERNAVIEAFNRWMDDPPSGVAFAYAGTTTACDNVWDGVKSVCWKDFPDTDHTIAYSWLRRGFPDLTQFAEADMVFNDDYVWSYSWLRSVATHEGGHWVGLGDLYDNGNPEDNNQVMAYGTDIYWGDAMGLRYIYDYVRYPSMTVGDENQGLGADIANLDGDSTLDVVVAWADNPSGENAIRWTVGLDIRSSDGFVQVWKTTRAATFWIGAENSGVGVATATIDADSTPDMLVAWVTNPSGENGMYYRVGWDVASTGIVSSWSSMKTVPGWVGSDTYGMGAAIANIGGSSRPDLVVAWTDSIWGYRYYKIGWDLSTSGIASSWGSAIAIPDQVIDIPSVGLALGDIDQNGILDLVFSYGNGAFHIGWDLSSGGQVAGWSRSFLISWSTTLGDRGQGLAIHKFAGIAWPAVLGLGIWGQLGADQARYIWS